VAAAEQIYCVSDNNSSQRLGHTDSLERKKNKKGSPVCTDVVKGTVKLFIFLGDVGFVTQSSL